LPALDSIKKLLSNPKFIFWAYVVIAVIVGLQCVVLDMQMTYAPGSPDAILHSSMNNYTIYSQSFYHLIHHQTLYGYFDKEYFDLYLYSPSFPFIIMLFALMPVSVGVTLWCVFNALVLFFAVRLLNIDEKKKLFIHWFVLAELITSIQNVQVNPLVAALFILAFIAFEKKKVGLAALIIALSMFIKVFGIVGASLFILYPGRLKFIVYFILWSIVIFFSPLIFISYHELIEQYKGWFNTILSLHSMNEGDFSAMQLLASLFRFTLSDSGRYMMQGTAVILFCVKYIRYKQYENPQYKLLFLASILVWCTIFNNAVESPSFIIAITGVSIWYIADAKSKLNLFLLIFALILTSFSHSDLFPRVIRDRFVDPYVLKCLPCFLVWIKIEFELVFGKRFILTA
jgi:hypothetical protein